MGWCFICETTNKSLSHHKFPQDPVIKTKWLNALNLNQGDIISSTVICSKHFSSDLVSHTKDGRTRILSCAVPNLFLGRKGKQIRPRIKDESNITIESLLASSIECPTTWKDLEVRPARKIITPRNLRDCSDFDFPEQSKINFNFAVGIIMRQQKKIKMLQQNLRRAKEKNGSLVELLAYLRKKEEDIDLEDDENHRLNLLD